MGCIWKAQYSTQDYFLRPAPKPDPTHGNHAVTEVPWSTGHILSFNNALYFAVAGLEPDRWLTAVVCCGACCASCVPTYNMCGQWRGLRKVT